MWLSSYPDEKIFNIKFSHKLSPESIKSVDIEIKWLYGMRACADWVATQRTFRLFTGQCWVSTSFQPSLPSCQTLHWTSGKYITSHLVARNFRRLF
jgi:hypothetical protein